MEPHRAWILQCEAAEGIRERFGAQKALGYLIGEKLMAHLHAAEQDPKFAAELPSFVAHVRELFQPHDLRAYLDSVRRVGAAGHALDDHAFAQAREAGMFEENIVESAADILRMGRVRELLLPESASR